MAETLVVVSKIKKMAKAMELRTGADAIEKLSQIVEARIKQAAEKTKQAGRKTIQSIDIE